MEEWLRGDNLIHIQGNIMVLVHFTSSHLSINQVSFQSMLYEDMTQTCIQYVKNKWLREDNSENIQSRIMVRMHCPSSHCHLSI